MNTREMIDKIYDVLVNQVPGIREKYKKKREQTEGLHRSSAWMYLLHLNVSYHIFRNHKIGTSEKYPYYESKKLYSGGSESSLSKRISPQDFAKELSQYDVVSFDVFDTLIFRPFSSPADLFYALGDELAYMDFKRIRMEMEWKAREKKYKKEHHYEVDLKEIYETLSEETGIDAGTALEKEVELEYRFCFANPYMKQVVEQLRHLKKRIIITSDMYLNTGYIKTLLEKCDYGSFDAYYVSCDIRKSKSTGNLYDEVRRQEERAGSRTGLTFIHVGDNVIADVKNAKDHGFAARHYMNVNEAGMKYRPEDMSCITGSVYRGLVNAHIHNGLHEYSREYEYGYIYGGLFVTGYCQFIHDHVHRKKTDRILFLARDGDVLIKAYKMLYPEDAEMCRYVYWSRLAATKMAAQYFKYDYFRRFLYHKVNQGYTLEKILETMELEDMLSDLEKETGLAPEVKLTDKNVEKIKAFLMDSWEWVLEHYSEQLEAGRLYFSEILEGCGSAVAVDIGWAGSGAIALNHIVNHVWKMNCSITGIIAGTNSAANAEPDATETFLQTGKLVSYMYSQRENRDLWKFHDPGKNHNLYWEALLDAPHGSLKGFFFDKLGEIRYELKILNIDVEKIREVQKGVLYFVKIYKKYIINDKKIFGIYGRDSYSPVLLIESERNSNFVNSKKLIFDEKNVV